MLDREFRYPRHVDGCVTATAMRTKEGDRDEDVRGSRSVVLGVGVVEHDDRVEDTGTNGGGDGDEVTERSYNLKAQV